MAKKPALQNSSAPFTVVPSIAIIVMIILGLSHAISYWWSIGVIAACMVWTTLITASRGQKKLARWEAIIQWGAILYMIWALVFGLR